MLGQEGTCFSHSMRSRGSSVSVVTRLRARTTVFQFAAEAVMGFFLFAIMSISALGPTQPTIQCVRGALTPGSKAAEARS